MVTKTVHIDTTKEFWARVKYLATIEGVSISQLIVNLLKEKI